MFRSNRRPSLVLLPTALLTAAHLMTVVALLSFGTRAGGYPLHATGLIVYVVATALTIVGLAVRACQIEAMHPTLLDLPVVSAPVLVGLLFWAGLGGSYGPYDPHDSDLVSFFSLSFAAIFSVVAVTYGSFSYLGIACIVQLALYFGTYALPDYLHYPSAGILGAWPWILGTLMGVYIAGVALLFLRTASIGRRKPGLWVAAMLTGLAGAWFLHRMLMWLPSNGAYLGYISAETFVPEQAWDWTRAAAQVMAIMAIVGAAFIGPLALLQDHIARK